MRNAVLIGHRKNFIKDLCYSTSVYHLRYSVDELRDNIKEGQLVDDIVKNYKISKAIYNEITSEPPAMIKSKINHIDELYHMKHEGIPEKEIRDKQKKLKIKTGEMKEYLTFNGVTYIEKYMQHIEQPKHSDQIYAIIIDCMNKACNGREMLKFIRESGYPDFQDTELRDYLTNLTVWYTSKILLIDK